HEQAIIFLGKSLVHCWVSGTTIHLFGLVLMLTPGQGKLLLCSSGLLRVVWGVVCELYSGREHPPHEMMNRLWFIRCCVVCVFFSYFFCENAHVHWVLRLGCLCV